MARLLKKFGLRDGDILALKHQSEIANEDAIKTITKGLAQMGLSQVLVIVVGDFNDLTVLNETAMNARGWYRLKTLQRVMRPEKTEAKDD